MNRLTAVNRQEVQAGTQIQQAQASRQATNTGRFIEERPQTGRNGLQHIVGPMGKEGQEEQVSSSAEFWLVEKVNLKLHE